MIRLEKQILQNNMARQLTAALLTLLASFLFISFGLLVKYSIDNKDLFFVPWGIAIFCGSFLAIRLLMPMIYALIELVVHGYCINAEARIRNETFRQINSIYADEMEKHSRGEMISAYEAAMGSISTYIRTIWSDSAPVVFQTLFIIVSVFFYLGPVIAFEFLLIVTLYVCFIIKMTSARFPLVRNVALTKKQMSASLHELCALILPAKIYNAAPRSEERYRTIIAKYGKAQQTIRNEFFRFGALTSFLSTLGSALILLTASSAFAEGDITFGSLLMLATFLFQVFLPLNRMGALWRTVSRARIDFQILNEKLSKHKKHYATVNKNRLPSSEELSIQLDNVCKSKGDNAIFNDLNGLIRITIGQPVFLRGRNGAGKTSLIRIIAGIDKPDDGCILINGLPRKNDDYGIAPPCLSLAPQSLTLLNDTISNNIKFLLGRFDEEEFERLASRLNFNRPLSQAVSNLGGSLSGGELQKLNIIIALLRKSNLLILDEPTSNLDFTSIAALKEIIQAYAKSFKVLIITHDQEFLRSFPSALQLEVNDQTITVIPKNQTVSYT
ncbi:MULTISPECIES: ATP-binding cassette domain-containing protein [Pseudomonas]|uniref:ATP-binding cassette domain-containing protein n=1 Tax=Pseudomonas TaxID=286 RepID=UPI000CF32456|nr:MULTISPECIES: ABC transporter ATP-binding protein [Pseudomonas]MBD8238355.1 ABC transporter ATP-binding protein [Pseudomonas fluorescens]MDY0895881.1 ABC transporter ATP-binding protein [Pseudomonas fluorescens]NJJ55136.1 ABC transporter ATP-binding protein [Pseudomonas sp. B14(2022)]